MPCKKARGETNLGIVSSEGTRLGVEPARSGNIAHDLPGGHPPIENEHCGGRDEGEFIPKHAGAQRSCKPLNDYRFFHGLFAVVLCRLTEELIANPRQW